MPLYIDLSLPITHHMPRYPSPYLPDIEVIPAATHQKEGRSAHSLRFGTHSGTHIDAPFHMIPEGKKISEISFEILMGPARLLHFPDRDRKNPVNAKDFGKIPDLEKEERLILHTGWLQKYWGQKKYFTEGPFLTPEAASFLATLPKLKLLGMDFPNIDSPENTKMGIPNPNHVTLLKKEVILLENLDHLEQLPELFELIALPLPVHGIDGAPCRAIAKITGSIS